MFKAARRFYDRKRYLRDKKLEKARLNQENVSFRENLELLRTYALGEDKTVMAICQLPTDKRYKSSVELPKSLSQQEARILVFCKDDQVSLAKKLGATFAGGEDLIQEFDKCLATKELFPQVIKIAKLLGPRGLMPSPAKGTVSDDLESMMQNLKASTSLETDSNGQIRIPIASTKCSDDIIHENVKVLFNAVLGMKPSKVQDSKFIELFALALPDSIALKLPTKTLIKK